MLWGFFFLRQGFKMFLFFFISERGHRVWLSLEHPPPQPPTFKNNATSLTYMYIWLISVGMERGSNYIGHHFTYNKKKLLMIDIDQNHFHTSDFVFSIEFFSFLGIFILFCSWFICSIRIISLCIYSACIYFWIVNALVGRKWKWCRKPIIVKLIGSKYFFKPSCTIILWNLL